MKLFLACSAIVSFIGVQALSLAALADDLPDLSKFRSMEEMELACISSLVALEERGVISKPKEGSAQGAAAFACGCLIMSAKRSAELQTVAEEVVHALQQGASKGGEPDLRALKATELGLVEEQEASAGASLIAAGGSCPEISTGGGQQLAR